MALLSLTMKSAHHHPGASAADFLNAPPSPPLSSPSPSSSSAATAAGQHEDDFRSSVAEAATMATSRVTSDSDRPLKKRRKQERPSLFVDHRSASDDDNNETDTAQSMNGHSRGNASEVNEDAVRNYGYVWNELPSTLSPSLRSGRVESSPEMPARDGYSDREDDVATSRPTARPEGDDEEDDDEFVKSNAAVAAIDFRKTFDRLNGHIAGDPSAAAASETGPAPMRTPPPHTSSVSSVSSGGLSTAGSMLLRQLVFQNPLLAAAGRNFENLPAMTASPSSPSHYSSPVTAARPTPPPPAAASDPFGGAAASDDGEGGPDDGDGGPETCPECQKVFKRRVYLQRHMAREHWSTARVFKCDKCAYETKHQSNLLVHRRTHTGERPYHCGACGQRYTQGHLLKAHIRSRHGSEMAYYNMDKRSDGVRCRRALNAIRAAAAVHAVSGGPSPQVNHGSSGGVGSNGGGSGAKEDKIRFLLEAAEATRNNQQQQQHPVPGATSSSLVQQASMAAPGGPFSAMALGQYVSALSNCLPPPQQHQIPISAGGVVGPPPGLVRGPLIWTPSTNMSLAAAAAAAGLIGGPAAAAAAAAFQSSQQQQQQQQFNQRPPGSTASDAGLAMTSHAALLSSLAATPFQPIVGCGPDGAQQQRSVLAASTAVSRVGGPGDASLLSSLLQTAPYGGGVIGGTGLPFALPAGPGATETSSSPSRRRRRASGSDRQSPEDLSTGGGRRRIDDDEAEPAVGGAAAATPVMTPMAMMSFLSKSQLQKHLSDCLSPFGRKSTLANGVNMSGTARNDDGKKSFTTSGDDEALNLATSSTPPVDGTAAKWSESSDNDDDDRDDEKATDLSAHGTHKKTADFGRAQRQSPSSFGRRRTPNDAAAAAMMGNVDDERLESAELDLSRPKKRGRSPAENSDSVDGEISPSSGIKNSRTSMQSKPASVTQQPQSAPATTTKIGSSTTCCPAADPSSAEVACPHLMKLRQLRRNVYRMLSVFTPYLDVAGVGGVADVEADSVDDFLHEVIYSSNLGSSSAQ